MLKATTENELMAILKKYAAGDASLNEANDSAQENYINAVKKERESFGYSIDEQEEEAAEEPTEEKEEQEEEEIEEKDINPKSFETSFDTITKDINSLRAGRSIKDKEIKTELLSYYDRLSTDERKILHIFLKQLSKILQGAIEGTEAIDPSDPPLNVDITFPEKEEKEEPSADLENKEPTKNTPAPARKTGVEDVSPPIKVKE